MTLNDFKISSNNAYSAVIRIVEGKRVYSYTIPRTELANSPHKIYTFFTAHGLKTDIPHGFKEQNLVIKYISDHL